MASALGVEFEPDFSMDLFGELTSISVLQLSEPEDDIAMGFSAEVLNNNEQLEYIPKFDIELIMTETPVTMNCMSALSSNLDDPSEPNAESISQLSSDTEEDNIQNILPDETEDTQDLLASDHEDETEPTGLNMKLTVIVSMIAPFADDSATLIHAGDFMIEVNATTTIRDIKYGITNALEICYEDMALVFVGKFLSDSRTVEYYLIDDGQTLHLLVETPNKLFKDVFEAFKRLSLSEEKAWFATRSFIHVMHSKYSVQGGFGNDETPALTDELLLHELEQLYIPDSDDSDDSSADEDELDINIGNIDFAGGMGLQFIDGETDGDEDSEEHQDSDEDEDIEEDQDNSENEDQNSEDEDNNSEDDEDDNDEVSDVDEDEEAETHYLTSQALAYYTPVELFE